MMHFVPEVESYLEGNENDKNVVTSNIKYIAFSNYLQTRFKFAFFLSPKLGTGC